MKFIIAAPAYTNKSGGIIALHQLAHQIALRGFRSFIYSPSTFATNLATHVLYKYPEILSDAVDSNAMVIYPEVVIGNPLKAKNVTRWLLHYPGVMGGDGVYGPNDLVFKYAANEMPGLKLNVHGTLTANNMMLDKFYDKKKKRSGLGHIIRKGAQRNQIYHLPWSKCLDPILEAEPEARNCLFNKLRLVLSYDHLTFHSTHAALAGCISVIHLPKSNNAQQIARNAPYLKYGVAFGYSDIPRALKTISQMRASLETIRLRDNRSVDEYLEFVHQKY